MLADTNSSPSKNYQNNPSEDEPIVVFCAADDKYAMPLAVMVRSIIENLNTKRKLLVFVLDEEIKGSNKEKIVKSIESSRCEIRFIAKPRQLIKDIIEAHNYCKSENIENKTHLSIAAYYRLLVAEVLPESHDKAIYLDCDLIVNKNLELLWEVDLGESHIMAVPDMWINSVSASNGLLNYEQLGINADSKYFNSGVLLISLKKWRSNKIFYSSVEYFKKNKEFVRFHDQDILNAILWNSWSELDARWNVTPGIYEYHSWEDSPFPEEEYNLLINSPYIYHFATYAKPWNSIDVISQNQFFHYLDKTEWSGWRFSFKRQLQKKIERKIKKIASLVKG